MHVARWGNSLAVRLPASVVQNLSLQEGDAVDFQVVNERTFRVQRKLTREEAIKEIQAYRFKLPADYKFNREELYDRELGRKEVR